MIAPPLPTDAPLPLTGIKVLDLTRALAGPFCTMILGDLGADVIKVEPADGDMIRQWGPFDRGTSAYYLSGNRNKRGMSLDFRHPEAMQLLRELAGKCDVVAENFKPGTMEKMGLGYESLTALNPRLIFLSVTGFGKDGPAGMNPGFDQIAQGYSGLMSVTGSVESGPTRVGVAIGDQTAGMWSAIGTLAAVVQRQSTGKGQRVDTSLLSSLVGLLSVQGQRFLSLGETPGLAGNTHPVISPYGVFQTADGPLNIAPAKSDMWMRLCELLGCSNLLTDPRFTDNAARIENRHELKRLLEEKLLRHERQYWTEKFLDAGIPAGPINNIADVFSDPQVKHCGLVEEIEHAELGTLKQVGNPVRMDGLQGRSIRRPPPSLGEHTLELLSELGLSPSTIHGLVERKVVFQKQTQQETVK
jgi:crotonobetainyl-CoA:carnitine CoA-transferase CaiB-like acyl-CoA transferase